MNRSWKRLGWFVVGAGALSASIAAFVLLVETRPTPAPEQRRDDGLLVEVAEVHRDTVAVSVRAQGLVSPAEEVVITPEVAGRVVWQDERLIAGGRFAKGETLLRIDARDYRYLADQQEAAIERAEVALDLEQGRRKVAEREWKLLGPGDGADEASKARALREPQLRAARNDLAAARSGYRRAKLAVEKSTLRAPFNAIVTRESVGAGQQVGLQPVATLVNTDRYLVYVTVPTATLSAIRVGASARIRHDLGNAAVERTGTVVRLLGDMDPTGQMAKVAVEVVDPLGDGDGPPLLLGAFVDVDIEAGELRDVVEVSRSALRNGGQVFVKRDGLLDVRPVDIAWREPDVVYVSAGLEDGDEIITSRVPSPVDGMRVRTSAETLALAR